MKEMLLANVAVSSTGWSTEASVNPVHSVLEAHGRAHDDTPSCVQPLPPSCTHHRLLFKYYTHILAHTSLYSCSATKSTGPSTCSMMMSFSFDPLATRSGKMYVYAV